MHYVKIVLGLIQLATALAKYFERQGYLRRGEAEAIAAGIRKEADDVEIALRVRRSIRDELERSPERVRDDDGFQRRD